MLHAQMDRGTLKNARLTYRGEIAAKNTRLVTAAFAAQASSKRQCRPRQS